jgi:hypothetical protein
VFYDKKQSAVRRLRHGGCVTSLTKPVNKTSTQHPLNAAMQQGTTMTKLITTTVATLLTAIILLQGSAFASGNNPPKTGSSNRSSYNKTVNKTVVNNTVINKSGSNSISSGYLNKTFSTSKHTRHYHYWCGWYSGYCGSDGCYRPTFWWFGDGPTAAVVDPDSDDDD